MTTQQAFELALVRHQAGLLAEAEALYGQILAVEPRHAGALHYLGVVAHQTGRQDLAMDWIGQSVAVDPNNPAAHANLGEARRVAGRLDEALGSFTKAIQLKPDHALAHYNLGNVYVDLGRSDEAVAAYRRALELKPDYAQASNNLGAVLAGKGEFDQAIAAYRRALALHPGFPEAHHNLGLAFAGLGQFDEAIAAYQCAVQLKPDFAIAFYHLGLAFKAQGRLDEAAAAYQRAVQIEPGYVGAQNNLGVVQAAQMHLDAAVGTFRSALERKADVPEVLNNLGNALKDRGELDTALQCYDRAIAAQPDNPYYGSNRLCVLNLRPDWDAEALLAEHRQWDARYAKRWRNAMLPHHRGGDPARRLKIGYVSPDLRAHSVARFLLPLLEKHDHQQVEVFCYSDVPRPDAVTERLRGYSDQWRDTADCPDEKLAQWIREDEIDLLVDLAGHTSGNRLPVFARQPAPLQVSWLGYANTTGLEAMDYRLTDALADPPGETEAWYRESLFRLPRTAWCFASPAEFPVLPPRGGPEQTITFGSFNALNKISEPMLQLWARILQAVPDSRLMLKALGLESQTARERVRSVLTAAGITASRLEFRGHNPSPLAHLAAYGEIDIALDTFPAHGTTTTCETLWMNVPVVTMAGRTPASRMGVSLLSNMGLCELVAQNEEDYLRIAVELAADRPRLRQLQATLRTRLQASPLTDAVSFARDVEAAYRTMWQRWCARAVP
ncbi:MAG: tetratricopeptide repeat protein [Chthoniobacter sp.]|nr:tetratricopeptide repeat protein [Chthoniobacter sp.]